MRGVSMGEKGVFGIQAAWQYQTFMSLLQFFLRATTEHVLPLDEINASHCKLWRPQAMWPCWKSRRGKIWRLATAAQSAHRLVQALVTDARKVSIYIFQVSRSSLAF